VILYLDTSSLVKLYAEEAGSDEVRDQVARAAIACTSVVAYAEARAALARRRRERGLTTAEHRRAKQALDRDWPKLLTLDVTGSLARRAGELAEKRRLRGFDSLHLASYLVVCEDFDAEEVRFSSFDRRLNRAAANESRGDRAANPR
jgi:uncharacterized protein